MARAVSSSMVTHHEGMPVVRSSEDSPPLRSWCVALHTGISKVKESTSSWIGRPGANFCVPPECNLVLAPKWDSSLGRASGQT